MDRPPEGPRFAASGLPGEPSPWTGPSRCPRCDCESVTRDPVEARFLLLHWLEATTCNKCGFHFSARSGRSIAPVVVAAYVVPLTLIVVFVVLVLVNC